MPVEPGWLSLLPPLVAIVLALVFREVVISLFAGIWFGALIAAQWNPLTATMISVDRFIVEGLADTDKISIVVFSLLLGGMVGVIGRSGGTLGLVESMRSLATSARRGQVMGWLAGVIIFFDDYANTLIVGNTMRPVTDRLNISREKLAYIVDSTAAPMAAIAVISTWVGFEISLIGDALRTAASQTADPAAAAQLMQGAQNPFNVFLHSIPYLFYPILALVFVLLVSVTGRDFGPMLKAEQRARRGEGVSAPTARPAVDVTSSYMSPPQGVPHRWYNAAIPVLTVIVVALAGIFYTGAQEAPAGATLWQIVGGADPFKTLIWASFSGNIVAIALAVAQRILKLGEALEAWLNGLRAMLLAIVILVLAWGLGGVTEALGTGPYLSGLLQDTLPLGLLPVIVFITGAAISFATGTSWGTMAILFPVTIPLAVAMGAGVDFDGGAHYSILLGVISSVMAGSIFGDHCSPISDTTVMSSMATACDHIDHVRTQIPYALVVAMVGMLVGDIPTAYGLPPWVSLAAGVAILYLVLRYVGRPVETGPEVTAG
ncbi:MAG: Na+/H+ antiporter NhaC family protein, partial [Candidatus Cloacimonetes bacterium]|nr:Na+/H+ antiporter NhaC family protein [Candidatus Cloacimonadota bacterium]